VLLAGLWLGCALPAQVLGPDALAAPSASTEKLLDPKHVIELSPGDLFAVRVSLHLTKVVNLGNAELRITLAPDAPHAPSEEDVVLIAQLATTQVLLAKGVQALLLHGVVPAVEKSRLGAWHASDYTIHLGSGNTTNVGTPDEQFIDTKTLAETLSALHLKLVEAPKE
jgi:hypothetical protein